MDAFDTDAFVWDEARAAVSANRAAQRCSAQSFRSKAFKKPFAVLVCDVVVVKYVKGCGVWCFEAEAWLHQPGQQRGRAAEPSTFSLRIERRREILFLFVFSFFPCRRSRSPGPEERTIRALEKKEKICGMDAQLTRGDNAQGVPRTKGQACAVHWGLQARSSFELLGTRARHSKAVCILLFAFAVSFAAGRSRCKSRHKSRHPNGKPKRSEVSLRVASHAPGTSSSGNRNCQQDSNLPEAR